MQASVQFYRNLLGLELLYGGERITIEERYCRGDWDIPKSEASRATISVNGCVVDRLQRLKGLTIKVKAGFGTRIYEASKDTPEGLIFLLGARRKADEG